MHAPECIRTQEDILLGKQSHVRRADVAPAAFGIHHCDQVARVLGDQPVALLANAQFLARQHDPAGLPVHDSPDSACVTERTQKAQSCYERTGGGQVLETAHRAPGHGAEAEQPQRGHQPREAPVDQVVEDRARNQRIGNPQWITQLRGPYAEDERVEKEVEVLDAFRVARGPCVEIGQVRIDEEGERKEHPGARPGAALPAQRADRQEAVRETIRTRHIHSAHQPARPQLVAPQRSKSSLHSRCLGSFAVRAWLQ